MSLTLVSPKAYGSIFKMFLNNRKTPIIPPLFYKNRFVTDSKKKAELFDSSFAKQCTVINNGSSLPSELLLKTDKFLSNVTFSSYEILRIIQNLDWEKAHGHEWSWMSRMLNYVDHQYVPLEIIFKSYLESGIFPLEWKKAGVVPVNQNDKQSLANYQPIWLLSICGKIFERLLYNEMFDFFITNHLIFTNQSGFKVAATDMRYFAKSKFPRSLVHKRNFSLIWQAVFKLGNVFC